jgi:hypothetical protein
VEVLVVETAKMVVVEVQAEVGVKADQPRADREILLVLLQIRETMAVTKTEITAVVVEEVRL